MDFERRVEAHEKWLAEHDRAIARIDKRLDAAAKLLAEGVKLVRDDRKRQKESNEDFDSRLKALSRLLDTLLRKSTNGHSS